MKQKVLTIEEYTRAQHAAVRAQARQLLTGPDDALTLRLRYFRTPVTDTPLLDLADLVKELGREREFTVDVVLETDRWAEVRRHRNLLNRFSVRIELWPTQARLAEVLKYKDRMLLELLVLPGQTPQEFLQAYAQWKPAGLSVRPACGPWSEAELAAFWDTWLQDGEAVWPEPWEDMATALLTGLGMQACRHASCLGSRLYLDEAGRVYFCGEKKPGSELPFDADKPLPRGSIFDCAPYRKALHAAVARRDACRQTCARYTLCKGGCPLEPPTGADCARLRGQAARMQAAITDGLPTAFAQQPNPCLRTLLLSLAAYGLRYTPPAPQSAGSAPQPTPNG